VEDHNPIQKDIIELCNAEWEERSGALEV